MEYLSVLFGYSFNVQFTDRTRKGTEYKSKILNYWSKMFSLLTHLFRTIRINFMDDVSYIQEFKNDVQSNGEFVHMNMISKWGHVEMTTMTVWQRNIMHVVYWSKLIKSIIPLDIKDTIFIGTKSWINLRINIHNVTYLRQAGMTECQWTYFVTYFLTHSILPLEFT